MRDESDYLGEDPLDRLLGGAHWPAADPLRVARLQREWDRGFARRQQRRRRIRLALSAAAVFVAAALGVWWIFAAVPGEQLVAPREPERRDAPSVARVKPQQPIASPETAVDLNAGRDPNAYELLVLRATEKQRRTTRDDPLEPIVRHLLADPSAAIEELVAPLIARRAVHERRLLQSIPKSGGERQVAETRVLIAIGSSRSVPLLVQLSRQEPTHSIAMAGLKRLADSAALVKLASAESDEQVQQELLAVVLDRGDPESLGVLLDAVRDPRTSRSAVAVFEGSAKPPVDSLVALLNAPDAERRATAAGLLGRSKHPDAIARLIEMARKDSTRQPALMALLASDDPRARRFLAEAWNHPQARSAVQLAQLEWQVAAWQVSLPKFPEVH